MEAAISIENVVLDISHPGEASSSNTQLGSSPKNHEKTKLENSGGRVQVSPFASPPPDGIARQTRRPNIPPPPAQIPKKSQAKTTRLISERKLGLEEKNPQPAEEKEEPFPRWSKWTFRAAILESVLSVFFLGCLGASLSVQVIKNYMILQFQLWKWCVLFMVIFCRPFIKLMMKVVVFVIQRSSLLNDKFLNYVHALRRCVQIIVWFGSVLLTWGLLFDNAVKRSNRTTQILNYITRSLASLLIGAALWAVKNLVLEFLASSFQVTRFFDRIQRSIIDQYILEVFSVCTELTKRPERVKRNKTIVRLIKNLQKQKVGEEEDQEVIDWLMKVKPGKLSAWNLKQLVKTITDSGLSSITNEVEMFVREQDDKKITAEVELQLNRVANLIFRRLRIFRPRSINAWDLKKFFGNETELVLKHINGEAGSMLLKRPALKDWLVNASLERISLAQSFNYRKRAISELNRLVSGIVLSLSSIVWLLLMEIVTTNVFVLILSQFLLLGFMFGNTAKSAFEGIIFVFVTNPFGEGDCCLIDGNEMIVEEINILTTVFRKNGKDTINYQNCVLASLPIRNFYDGNLDVSDYVELAIDSSTTSGQIRDVEVKIKAHLEKLPHYRLPSHSMMLKDVDRTSCQVKMVLYVTHRSITFQNFGDTMSQRRSELVNMLKKIFEKEAIEYHYIQPQDVSLKLSAMVH